jgi:hypothetical protein
LTITNIGLGVVVLICAIAVGIGILQEVAAKRRKRLEMTRLDKEVADLVASYGDGHAFDVPGLGLTMADGGEKLDKDKED